MVQRTTPWSNLPRFRRGAFALFLTTLLLSAILADQPLATVLLLDPARFARGEALWQPLTAAFIFREGTLFGLFGTLVVQWFVAGALEQFWGTRRYLAFAIGCGVAGYLGLALFGLLVPAAHQVIVGGATPIDLSAVVAFGVVFGRRPLRLPGRLPLSPRGLALLVCGVALLSPLARGAPWPDIVPWAVSIVTALVVTTQPWRRLASSGKLRGRKTNRERNHLQVVRSGKDLLN
jgi:membrane associated rhomboid family serine protease